MGTLLSYATNERDTYKKATDAAQASLASAQDELKQLKATAAEQTKAAADTDGQIAKKRAELANTSVPSEAKRLIEELTQLAIKRREQQGDLVSTQKLLDTAQAELAFQQARHKRVSAQLADADKTLTATKTEHDRREANKTACSKAPLDKLADDAKHVLESTLWTDAKAKFGATVLPAELLDGAKARHAAARARIAAAQTAAKHAYERAGSAKGQLGVTEAAFRTAEREIAQFVRTAKQDLDRANVLVQKLVAKDYRVLTDSQSADALDTAKLDERKQAHSKEAAVIQKADALAQATDKLEAAKLIARAKNPVATEAEIDDDAAVKAAYAEQNTAKTAYDRAAGEFSAAHRTTLATWHAIIPDDAWQKLYDFLELGATLRELSGSTPEQSVDSLTSSEDAYAVELAKAAATARSSGFVDDVLTQQTALADAAIAARTQQVVAAVRGDNI